MGSVFKYKIHLGFIFSIYKVQDNLTQYLVHLPFACYLSHETRDGIVMVLIQFQLLNGVWYHRPIISVPWELHLGSLQT